jgi:aldehyde dehydrogenase (NAD+)
MLETSGGSFYEPTVLCDVSDASHIVREEIFGPVLTLQVFTHEQEAFDCANSGRYGLNAAIFTSDLGRALRAVRQLESGTVWVNHYARSADFNLPTGGFKSSGYGKDLGKEVVEQNLRSKSVLIAWDA